MDEAVALLTSTFRNVTAHEPPSEPSVLPCLCSGCLDPVLTRVDALSFTFHRDFVVERGRVLFFWVPRELERRREDVRKAVEGALSSSLRRRRARR